MPCFPFAASQGGVFQWLMLKRNLAFRLFIRNLYLLRELVLKQVGQRKLNCRPSKVLANPTGKLVVVSFFLFINSKFLRDKSVSLMPLHLAQAIIEAAQQIFIKWRKSENNLVISWVTPYPCPSFSQLKVQFRTVG